MGHIQANECTTISDYHIDPFSIGEVHLDGLRCERLLHQQATAPVPREGNRPLYAQPGKPRCHSTRTQQEAEKDIELPLTGREVRGVCCDDWLKRPDKPYIRCRTEIWPNFCHFAVGSWLG